MGIESKLLGQKYYLKFSDGSVWAIPVHVILMNHAEYCATHNGNDPMVVLESETIPYFEEDSSNIEKWAKNNMNWSDVQDQAIQITPPSMDFGDEWAKAQVKIAR